MLRKLKLDLFSQKEKGNMFAAFDQVYEKTFPVFSQNKTADK